MTVVILGGGPAGLAAATTLVRAGRAAVVHEAGSYPRHRVCGEFLSPDAAPALEALGLGGLAARLGAPELRAFRVTSSRGGVRGAETSFPLAAPGMGLSRLDFDEALAGHARREGVDLRERSRLAVLPADASAVILATGRGLRPGANGSPADAGAWIGVKVHVRGVDLPGVVEIHCVEGAYVGMSGSACRGERVVNVCSLVRSDAFDRCGRTPAGLWDLLAAESPPFRARWRSARVVDGTEVSVAGFGFGRRDAVVEGRALAVGDAAGLTAPLSGAGQAAALASGIEAARIVLERGEEAPAAWAARFRRGFRRRLAVGGALQRALLAPRAASLVLRIVAGAGPAATWLYRSTRGGW